MVADEVGGEAAERAHDAPGVVAGEPTAVARRPAGGLEGGITTGEPLRVVRDAHGAVSHLDLASFRFTREPYDPARDIPGGVDEAGWH